MKNIQASAIKRSKNYELKENKICSELSTKKQVFQNYLSNRTNTNNETHKSEYRFSMP